MSAYFHIFFQTGQFYLNQDIEMTEDNKHWKIENKNPVSRSNIHTTLEIPPKRVYKKMCVFLPKHTIVNMTLMYLIVKLIRWHWYSATDRIQLWNRLVFALCPHWPKTHGQEVYAVFAAFLCMDSSRLLCKDSLWTCATILWVPDVRFPSRAVLENSVLISFVFKRQAWNIRLSKEQFVPLILATMLYRFKTVYLFLFIQGLACRLNHLWQAVFNILCFTGVWAHSSGTTCYDLINFDNKPHTKTLMNWRVLVTQTTLKITMSRLKIKN